MTATADILVLGTGSFAARIAFDLAATTTAPVRVAVAGRNAERLSWLVTAGNARAAIFGGNARFAGIAADLLQREEIARVLADTRPAVVVQAASTQTSAVIATTGDAWSKLIADGGLSATALFQTLISARVAAALPAGCQFINCCFPDVVNPILGALGLPVTCGTGNVAILANAFAGHMVASGQGAPDLRAPDLRMPDLRMLAHYQALGVWRRAASERKGMAPRVWLGAAEVADVFARFSAVKLTPEPAIEISGAAGVPLIVAIATRKPWRGHVPGPLGLPGGYPVLWTGNAMTLDLPAGLAREEAIAWNARFEQENGLVVGADGMVRYTGKLAAALGAASPELARGFAVRDYETVYAEMVKLRARLQAARV
ncbi:MAG: hypothetical protein IT557_12695 [Alphaproteobacteria bacterium]|nr:hypothetical protein [Alphaproteobacteria bacterium]